MGTERVAISARDLAAGYDSTRIWDKASFEIQPGEFVAVLGPNGAGKSTLFRLLLGLQRPAAGRLEILGGEPRRGDRRIGYVPQRRTLDPDLPVRGRDMVHMGVDGHRWGMEVPGLAHGPGDRRVQDAIDAVVVGPGGTWALTLRAARGRYRKRNGHWYSWSPATHSWIPWEAAPVATARLAGRRLEMYLERATLPSAVSACLVPPRGVEIEWETGQRPGVSVIPDVDALAARIAGGGQLTKGQVDRIVALLDPRQPLPASVRAARAS